MKFAANAQLLINYNQSLKHNWLIFVSNSECIDGDGDGQAGWMDCCVLFCTFVSDDDGFPGLIFIAMIDCFDHRHLMVVVVVVKVILVAVMVILIFAM